MRRLALACLAFCLLPAAPAFAAGAITRSSPGSTVTYTASGAANVVLTDAPSGGGTAVTISEPGIALGMTAVDCIDNGASVTCTWAAGEDPRVSFSSLTAASDVIDGGALTLSTLSAIDSAGGDDTFTGGQRVLNSNGFPTGDNFGGSAGVDTIEAGAGNDQISDSGAGTGDLLDGGTGDDSFIVVGAGVAPDTLIGGEGTDDLWVRSSGMPVISFQVDLAPGTVANRATGTLSANISGFEHLRTDEGDDVLLGDAGPNTIRSGLGNDVIDGRLGPDEIMGEDGTDQLEARDGVTDRVDGGPGADTCQLDQLDESADCETAPIATVQPFGTTPVDATAPSCRLTGPRRMRTRAARRGGVSLVADCDEPGRVSARLFGPLPRKRAGAAKAGDVELARVSATLGAGDDARLRLRVPRRLRAVVRKGAALRVVLAAVDATGNRSTHTRTIRLR